MTAGLKTVIYPVTDLARAKTLYGKLLVSRPIRTRRTTSGSESATKKWVWIPDALDP